MAIKIISNRTLVTKKVVGPVLAVATLTVLSLVALTMPAVFATTTGSTTQVIRPGSMAGWSGVDDNGKGGSVEAVRGPEGSPLGTGSAQLSVTAANQGYMFGMAGYAGLKLADLTQFSYSTYIQQGNSLVAPSVQINVTPDVDNGATAWYGRLVYEPYMSGNGTVRDGQWQTWSATDGKWWLSKPAAFEGKCAQDSPCTISEMVAAFPNIGVNRAYPGVGFKAGSGWENFVGNVDNVRFVTNTMDTTYDFEGPEIVAHNASQNRDYSDLNTAISEASAGEVIKLTKDITLVQQVNVTKQLTIDGAGHTLAAAFTKTDYSNNAALGIQANGVTVQNLVVDGTQAVDLHGINVWHAANVTLTGVTVQNNKYTGLNVGEGAAVTVKDLTTVNNGWHGVDVDKVGATLTITGTSSHSETAPSIFIDNIAVGTVNDMTGKYGSVDFTKGTATARVMNLKLAAPANLTPSNNSTVYRHDFSNTWSKVAGAAKYEYTTTYGAGNAQVYSDNSDSTNYDLSSSATVVRHNNGSPVSTYNWKVRAVDAYGIAGDWVSSTVTYALPNVVTKFTTCDAFNLTFFGYSGNSTRITWYDDVDATGKVVGYTDRPLSTDSVSWGSGSGKLAVKSVKYVVTDSTKAVIAQGTVNNPTPCSYTTAGWATDGMTFNIAKMNLPVNYSVVISWPGNTTTKSMADMNAQGWWSAGNRLSVKYFTYTIKDASGKVIYTSPQISNPKYVDPIISIPEGGTETDNPITTDSNTNTGGTGTDTTPATTPVAPAPAALPVATTTPQPLRVATATPVAVVNNTTETATPEETTAPEATPAVLGANTDTNNQGEVLGATTTRSASTAGLFGSAWYWALAAVAALGGFWWFIAARKKRRKEEEEIRSFGA